MEIPVKSSDIKEKPDNTPGAPKGEDKVELNESFFKIISGNTPILLLAPHGRAIKPRDDINTDQITAGVATKIGCNAIINIGAKRTQIDLNIVEQAIRQPRFIDAIDTFIEKNQKMLVIWIHGASDDSINNQALHKDTGFKGKPENLHALIGYGQGPNPVDKINDPGSKYTSKKETAEHFRNLLTQHGMTTVITRESSEKFRGRNPKNMNQYFLNKGHPLDRVESIQLEIRYTGFRKYPEDIKKTVKAISDSLSELITSPNPNIS